MHALGLVAGQCRSGGKRELKVNMLKGIGSLFLRFGIEFVCSFLGIGDDLLAFLFEGMRLLIFRPVGRKNEFVKLLV